MFITFVELDKAYDRVLRDLVYWCLRRRGVPEKLVRLVEATWIIDSSENHAWQN